MTLVVRPAMRVVSRITLTRPSPPGGTSGADAIPARQSHDVFTWSMRRSAVPGFCTRKTCATLLPCSAVPKSKTGSGTRSRGAATGGSSARTGPHAAATAATTASVASVPARRRAAVMRRRSVDADALRRAARRGAGADAVRVRAAAEVRILRARPAIAAAGTGVAGRRRVALLAVVDATVAARVPQIDAIRNRVRPVRRARIADPDGRRLDHDRQRRILRRGHGRVLGAEARERLGREERQQLDERDVRGAAAGVERAVRRIEHLADVERLAAETVARDGEAAEGGHPRLEPPRARHAELHLDAVERDRLVEQVALQLDPAAARVPEAAVLVGEEE